MKAIPLEIFITITEKQNCPCIELRKLTSDMELIKQIVSCAWRDQPIIVLPQFKNKIRAIGILQEKGIVSEQNGEYVFNF